MVHTFNPKTLRQRLMNLFVEFQESQNNTLIPCFEQGLGTNVEKEEERREKELRMLSNVC